MNKNIWVMLSLLILLSDMLSQLPEESSSEVSRDDLELDLTLFEFISELLAAGTGLILKLGAGIEDLLELVGALGAAAGLLGAALRLDA
jgi:hypothetical protein